MTTTGRLGTSASRLGRIVLGSDQRPKILYRVTATIVVAGEKRGTASG